MSSAFLAELKNLPTDWAFVFSRGAAPVGDYTDAKAKLDKLSGVGGWVHDLRRTMATRLGELGVASNVVEALLNHKTGASRTGVAGVYNRSELEPQQYRAINAWARYVLFVVDEAAYATWQARLMAADDEYVARLELADAILAGGTRWDSFLAALRSGEGRVVSLRGSAA